MAKSNFEPKKIVRYAESNIPKNGISSRPAPTIKATPSAAQAAVVAAVEAPAQPAPAPTPPPPPATAGETRSFFFDGATHLTGSYNHVGGRSLYRGTIHATLSPGWAQEETGSFTFFSVSNINNPNDYRRTFSIERVSGSDGYIDYMAITLTSGSVYHRTKKVLPLSPNFYSGSGGTNEEVFLQAAFTKGGVYPPRITTSAGPLDLVLSDTHSVTEFNGSTGVLANLALQDVVHTYSVGGSHGDAEINQYKGTIGNLSLSKHRVYYFNENIGPTAETNPNIHLLYRFEGNVSASVTTSNLDVIGTETYVSSSL